MDVVRLVLRLSLMLALGHFLMACSPHTAETVFPENKNMSTSCGSSAIRNEFLVTWQDGRVTLERSTNSDEFVDHFVKPLLNDIEHVEFNKTITLKTDLSAQIPGDYTYSNNWGQNMVKAASAWNQSIKGKDILVAVTDTAIQLNHSQLIDRIAVNEAELYGTAGTDDDGNGFVDDIYGWNFLTKRTNDLRGSTDSHGSHVAGIIAAEHSRGPVLGLAPEAKILPVTFLSEGGPNGEPGQGDLYGALQSLDYAAARGAKIINASWGGTACSETLRQSMNRLSSLGILVVVASGNNGADLESRPEYPAIFNAPTQITVASIRSSGYMSIFSNTSYKYVHLAAPGEIIYSTVPIDGVGAMSGTSMAAPFVTGAAALLWSHRPAATALQIKQALLSSTDAGNYRVETQGRLNIEKALQAIESLLP